MNAQITDTKVSEAVQETLRKSMYAVLQRTLTNAEKITLLTEEFQKHSFIQGEFSTEKQVFVGQKSLTFVGTVCGENMEMSVC